MALSSVQPGPELGLTIAASETSHNSVTLEWSKLPDCNTYVIEEKDKYGIGRVFVGHSTECILRGLDSMSEHQYRMKCDSNDNRITTPWITVYTSKEPVNCEHVIRACHSSGIKGTTPLMACAIDDFDTGACLLLENGADINIRNNDGKCALTMAALYGNDQIISLLLQNGANIAVKDRSGSNLLFSASDSSDALEGNRVAKQKPACFMTLLLSEDIIDPNEKNGCGWSPLHKIASVNDSLNSAECARLLVSNGAQIDIKDAHGNTPLCLAVITGNVAVTRTLLGLGASRSVRNGQNNSPERLAIANEFNKGTRSKEIAAFFKQ